ncbi:MBL fold metallo-hydrolase [bacterium]|nr:MBL fold metallo-hydrolase [bacterium]MDY3023082.1 MBL fold metallo-hydrolase [Oliverpabstia sp.]
MKKAVIEQQILGMVSTNVWFLKNKETGEILIIDPADQADRIERKIQMMEGRPVAVLLTHGHFDHIMAVEELQKKWNLPVYAMEKEREVLESPQKNLSGSWINHPCILKADCWLKDGEEMDLAGFRIRVLHTPGHTEGSCCYYLEEEGVLFSGDTLFCGSVGRTDMPTSSGRDMLQSIARIMKEIPEETRVCPGHNEETTIAYEKRYNPFA